MVDVEIDEDTATVWLLTNQAPCFERYQVKFTRERGMWVESLTASGFQTGTPEHVRARAQRLESGG